MKRPLSLWLIFGLAAAASAVAPSASASTAASSPVRIVKTSTVTFPRQLLVHEIRTGHASIIFSVDADGTLLDCLPISYTRPEFAEAALTSMRTWTFAAARINGEPVASRAQVDLEFGTDGFVVVDDVHEINAKFLGRISQRDQSSRLATAAELDQWPQPQQATAPVLPAELREQGLAGSVMVDFFIDETGRVRMPATSTAAHPALASAAVDTVSSWQFAPPTHDGKPVKVRVKQEFRFTDGASPASATP